MIPHLHPARILAVFWLPCGERFGVEQVWTQEGQFGGCCADGKWLWLELGQRQGSSRGEDELEVFGGGPSRT